MVHFNWTQLFLGHDMMAIAIATAAIAGAVMIVMSLSARVALGKNDAAVMPTDKFSLRGIFEVLTEFITNLTTLVVGEHGRHFAPMFAAIFLYIFFNNFFGLIPGMTPATENINTNLAAGLFVFVAYNYYGFKEHGIAYIKQFMGPIILLAPLMLVVELISHIVRPFSLAIRLQANMIGDHAVLGIFIDLVPYVVPVAFYLLGLFVCFMQAFVFTMLSMIYISMAISHDH